MWLTRFVETQQFWFTRFKKYWLNKNKTKPEKFPLDMDEERWLIEYLNWRENGAQIS